MERDAQLVQIKRPYVDSASQTGWNGESEKERAPQCKVVNLFRYSSLVRAEPLYVWHAALLSLGDILRDAAWYC